MTYLAIFMIVEFALRLILMGMDWSELDQRLFPISNAFVLGILNDALTFFILLPAVLALLLIGKLLQKNPRILRVYNASIFFIFCYFLLFISTSEIFFWEEFSSRFNFIAVDYLVYTHEVLHNILESYPVFPLLAVIAVISLGISFIYFKKESHKETVSVKVFLLSVLIAILLVLAPIPKLNVSDNRYNNELAKNGLSSLFKAYFQNELSYTDFYFSKPKSEAVNRLRNMLIPKATDIGLLRRVENKGPEKQLNIMMIVVESLSANYLSIFGNLEGLTPHLDSISEGSLIFTNVLATGTRTVYGLSAVTLSAPPLPGNSVIRRPGNESLFNISTVLNQKGYISKFIYGGYGYFDNMNYFYANNGFSVIDRSDFAAQEISFSNAWGVCDEDLFDKAIKESDKEYKQKRKFFNLIMTTSNHRPFTYPENKIDIKPKSGRKGGVKYTDYAIGQFIRKAKEREWFNDTVFVIVADHTAGSAGKSDIVPNKYHIPLIIYSPKHIKPDVIDKLASQIDIAPTLFGLLGFSYDSKFIGQDILDPNAKERAFISNYQQVGYVTKDNLIILKPNKVVDYQVNVDNISNNPMLDEAVGYFQGASYWQELLKE